MAFARGVPFGEAVRLWLRIGLLGFGGPAGQIALMQRELVERRRWIGPARFLHALNYCMLLPGPEAQQLAVYVGWLLHRTAGGIVAGALFVLPGALVILALSVLYAAYGSVAWVAALFYGLKPAVIAIVVEALVRIGRRALHGAWSVALAAAAYLAIALFAVPFPLILLGAALVGLAAARGNARAFVAANPHAPLAAAGPEEDYAIGDRALAAGHARPGWGRALRVAAVWLAIWWLPVPLLALALGGGHVLVREAVFFGQVAVVSFGGAYAVLTYVAQQAVTHFGWLSSGQMLDGLGLAETTPGPLILVTQFVGFMGAFHEPGPLGPIASGVAGSLVTLWAVFAPSYLWIFLGAPFVERLRGIRVLAAALAAITAAIVGVILNLSLWFALHTLFGRLEETRVLGARLLTPAWTTADPVALGIAIAAFLALTLGRWTVPAVIGAAALAGLAAGALRP